VIAFTQAIENSIELDYVTEKVYHALESGCIPVYYGAPNVNDYIPDAAGIINYSKLRSPAALLAELERLASDESAYNEKLAWRKKSLQQLAPGAFYISTLSSPILPRQCSSSRWHLQATFFSEVNGSAAANMH
jgi:hypothetical protein